jgi:hypothetical protein
LQGRVSPRYQPSIEITDADRDWPDQGGFRAANDRIGDMAPFQFPSRGVRHIIIFREGKNNSASQPSNSAGAVSPR